MPTTTFFFTTFLVLFVFLATIFTSNSIILFFCFLQLNYAFKASVEFPSVTTATYSAHATGWFNACFGTWFPEFFEEYLTLEIYPPSQSDILGSFFSFFTFFNNFIALFSYKSLRFVICHRPNLSWFVNLSVRIKATLWARGTDLVSEFPHLCPALLWRFPMGKSQVWKDLKHF